MDGASIGVVYENAQSGKHDADMADKQVTIWLKVSGHVRCGSYL